MSFRDLFSGKQLIWGCFYFEPLAIHDEYFMDPDNDRLIVTTGKTFVLVRSLTETGSVDTSSILTLRLYPEIGVVISKGQPFRLCGGVEKQCILTVLLGDEGSSKLIPFQIPSDSLPERGSDVNVIDLERLVQNARTEKNSQQTVAEQSGESEEKVEKESAENDEEEIDGSDGSESGSEEAEVEENASPIPPGQQASGVASKEPVMIVPQESPPTPTASSPPRTTSVPAVQNQSPGGRQDQSSGDRVGQGNMRRPPVAENAVSSEFAGTDEVRRAIAFVNEPATGTKKRRKLSIHEENILGSKRSRKPGPRNPRRSS